MDPRLPRTAQGWLPESHGVPAPLSGAPRLHAGVSRPTHNGEHMIWHRREVDELVAQIGRHGSRAETRASVQAVAGKAVDLALQRLPEPLRLTVAHYISFNAEMPSRKAPAPAEAP